MTSDITKKLVKEAEWTQAGAEALIALARQYGAFILRDATALAAALGIEDGKCGL